jgi:hypothetical protein
MVAVSDAPERRIVSDEPGKQATEAKPTPRRRRWLGRRQRGELYIYQHSNLLYWWPIWVWGYVCAAWTYAQGIGVSELASPYKVVLFHPSPWLGISFIAVVLFIAVFTNVRLRGIYSFVLMLVAGGLFVLLNRIPGIEHALGWMSLLRVHLNLAFYVTFSTVLLAIWLAVVGVADHFTWWRFSPSQVTEEHFMGLATGHTYNTEGMAVRRLPNDFFRHILLGWGTGDFMVRPAHDDAFEIHNVRRARRQQESIERALATRITESAPRKP